MTSTQARITNITPAFLRGRPLPVPRAGGKDERGRILVVGGAPQLPGALVLAATSALRAGAGKLQIATNASIAPYVGIAVPESLVVALRERRDGALESTCARDLLGRAQAVDALVFGPGMIEGSATTRLLEAVLASLNVPAVLDAAALACVGTRPGMCKPLSGRLVLTPHSGEMATLLGISKARIEADPPTFALQAAARTGSVVALKGAQTFIATPHGALYCNRTGSVGLATSGSGDTLAGIIGGLLARGLDPIAAAAWGVYAHARAGALLTKRIGIGFLAREIPAEIPGILRKLST